MVTADCSRVIKDLFYGSGKFLNNHQKKRGSGWNEHSLSFSYCDDVSI
jgi:hypothetical protein